MTGPGANGGAAKFGDWEKVGKTMDNLGARLTRHLVQAQRRNAEDADRIATKFLDSQGKAPRDLGWAPLNQAYKDWKGKLGKFAGRPGNRYSTDIYTMSATYRRNIAVAYQSGGLDFFVGVRRTVKNKDGQALVEIAYVLEYGSDARGIPARPLWRPTLEALWPIAQKRIREAVQAAFNEKGKAMLQ